VGNILVDDSMISRTKTVVSKTGQPPHRTTEQWPVLLETMDTSIQSQLWWLAVGERLGQILNMGLKFTRTYRTSGAPVLLASKSHVALRNSKHR